MDPDVLRGRWRDDVGMSDFHHLVVRLRWIDGQPRGTAALHAAPDRRVAFTGWLEFAAAVHALTDLLSPPA